jgi:hypothetical protein
MINKTFSHYRIVDKLGAGGMGEVYRAEDTKLGRQVAIKLLPDVFDRDPERLARFEREARLLASLNHPNIAAIYGLEEAEGKRFLVLELVEGQTREHQIGVGADPRVRPPGGAHRGAPLRAPESVLDRRGVSPLQAYALRPVTNCNCVAARRGGEQQEVNDPSVG